MHPPANLFEQMRLVPELGLECIAEPGTEGERQVSTAEEREAGPPVFLQALRKVNGCHDFTEADSGKGDQIRKPPPKIASAHGERPIPIAQNEDQSHQTSDREAAHARVPVQGPDHRVLRVPSPRSRLSRTTPRLPSGLECTASLGAVDSSNVMRAMNPAPAGSLCPGRRWIGVKANPAFLLRRYSARTNMTGDEIESFVRAFEDGSLPKSEWTHSRHLVMALWYIRREGWERATVLIREGIQRYNRAQDNPNGYHETITLAWVAVIDKFLQLRRRETRLSRCSSQTNCSSNAATRTILLQYYSRERLFSDECATSPDAPDIEAIHLRPDHDSVSARNNQPDNEAASTKGGPDIVAPTSNGNGMNWKNSLL